MHKRDAIAVSYSDNQQADPAAKLAQQLQLPLVENLADTVNFSHVLIYTPEYLGLKNHAGNMFHLDFLSGKILYRSKHAGLRKELIARAIGVSPREHPHIVDVTAGLGRDSFILASLGYEVTLLERSPIIHALLDDALNRARFNEDVAPIINRMHLIQADALTWLKDKTCDIITLDPMFPERKKSASVKKEMIIMQELLGADEDSTQLFELALTCAAKRIVVKRPRLAKNIANCAPSFSLTGKSSRFDIYLTPR